MGCKFMATESRHCYIKYHSFMLISPILICDEIFVFNREKFGWNEEDSHVIPILKFSVKLRGMVQEYKN